MPETTNVTNEEIKQLLEQNLEYNKAIYELARKTKRYMLIMQIMSWLRILLIVVPVILAIIYLPPLLKPYFQQYQELMGGSSDVMKQLQELQGTSQLQDLFR